MPFYRIRIEEVERIEENFNGSDLGVEATDIRTVRFAVKAGIFPLVYGGTAKQLRGE